jgi:alpha-ribazole phosphatase
VIGASARLWVVRHARPHVATGVCYGAMDVAADPDSTEHSAHALARTLPSGAIVLHSTLQRCELLALYLQALRPDLTYKSDTRLCEMDFGDWEGRAWDDIPRAEIDAWTTDFSSYRPGGGDSVASILGRVESAWHAAQSAAMPGDHVARDIVWITHAGVARCIAWLQSNPPGTLPRAHEWPQAAPRWGEWEVRPLGRPPATAQRPEPSGPLSA